MNTMPADTFLDRVDWHFVLNSFRLHATIVHPAPPHAHANTCSRAHHPAPQRQERLLAAPLPCASRLAEVRSTQLLDPTPQLPLRVTPLTLQLHVFLFKSIHYNTCSSCYKRHIYQGHHNLVACKIRGTWHVAWVRCTWSR